MGNSNPRVILVRGDDATQIEKLLVEYKQKLGNPDMADLNTNVLDGSNVRLDDIRSAALSMPFLTTKRLVIVRDATAPYEGRGADSPEKFLALLDNLPETTELVLVVDDRQLWKRGDVTWEKLVEKHWLMGWIRQAGDCARVVDCPLPTQKEMPGWVMKKAKELNGNFNSDAAVRLAEYVGNNTRRAEQEIIKLLTYANYDRPVTSNDVVLLTAQEQEGNIFALTDALGEGKGPQALGQLQLLLETNNALELSGMITRQFRLLIQAREILDERGGEAQVREELNLHSFVAQKLTSQARRFNIAQLEEIYHRLLKIDIDIKSGGMAGDVAFELLIAEMAG